MWQTIEYKAAAIEQFRKGDLLQRVIEDVQSEAANAAEMKAAASGNPLILHQVKLASDLRKLEALYSQHQRSQHRLRDRLRWLDSAKERLDKAGAAHTADLKRRDAHTRMRKDDKGKERIKIELLVDGRVLGDKDAKAIQNTFMSAVTKTRKESRILVGSYRGFEVFALRYQGIIHAEGYRFALKGDGEKEFLPDNLLYSFDDTISLSGWFQRMDNFLDKGLEQSFQTYKGNVEREIAELATVRSALGQDFAQKDELDLTWENHSAVMRELKRMQDEPGYVSTWEPKTSLGDAHENAHSIKKIAVIGSRTFDDYPMLESIVMGVMKENGVKPSDVTIVSGGAKGADSLGRDFAQKHSANYLEFLPDWDTFGKRAGVVRNANIVKNSDFVVALWDGQSRGTANSLELAQQAGKPYFAYNFVTQKEAVLAEQGGPPLEALNVEPEAQAGAMRLR